MDPWSTNDSGFDSPHNHSSIHSEDNIGNNNSNNGDGLRLPPPIDISVNFEIPDLMGVSGTDARAILSPPVLPNFMMESQKNSSSSFINNSTASGASTAVNNKFHNHETRLQQLLQSSSEWEPAILAGNYNSSSSSSDTTTTAACVDILARLRDYFAELANGLLVHAGGSSSGKFMDLVSHLMKATPVIISSSLAPAESTSLITGMMHSVSLQQSFTTSASTNDLNDSAMFMKLDIKRKSFSRLIHLQTLNWACLSKTDLVAIKDSIDQMLNYYNSTSAAAATATATSLSSLKHFSAMENSNPFSSPIPYFSSATTTSTSSLPVISEFEEDESTSIWNTAILNNTGRKLSRVSLSESSDSLSLILKSIQTDINLKKTVLDVESLVKLCQFSSSIQSTSSSSSSSFWGIEELVSLIEVAFYQPVMDLFAAALKE